MIDSVITIQENCYYIGLFVGGVPASKLTVVEITVMLNIGSTKLPFELHTENILSFPETTLEVGDSITNGQIIKQSYTHIFTGNEGFYAGGTNVSGIRRMSWKTGTQLAAWSNKVKTVACNLYNGVSSTSTYLLVEGVSTNGGQIEIYDENYNTPDSVDAFKAYLKELYESGNPLIVVAKTAEPISTEPITFTPEYIVYDKGSEEVLTPTDESGNTCFDYGANTTEEIEYMILLGGAE
jgi:hypothetical protein